MAGVERTEQVLRPPHLVMGEEHLPVTRPGLTDLRTQLQKSPPPRRRLGGGGPPVPPSGQEGLLASVWSTGQRYSMHLVGDNQG